MSAAEMTEGRTADGTEGISQPEQAQAASSRSSTDSKEKDSPLEQIIKLVMERAELFHTPDREAFLSFRISGHRETIRIADAHELLAHTYFIHTSMVPSQATIGQAVMVLSGRAKFVGPQFQVFTRIGQDGDLIYVDLGNESWEAIEISSEGWRIVSDVPVRFRRTVGMEALPRPEQHGSVEQIRSLLNVGGDDQWVLIISWLIAAFRPSGPYPVLVLEGPHGSAKSTLSRALRQLIDPNTATSRSEPANARDLMIAARNAWCQTFDNFSRMPPWLSDALCRLSTGGSFSIRKNYSDDAEMLFTATRPVLMNGIDANIQRGDLLDRAIMISLPSIPATSRLTEAEVWRRFEGVRAAVLGHILSAVSCALRRLPEIRLAELPRMADFVTWVTAAEPALGWAEGKMLAAYNRNRSTSSELALEASTLVPVLETLVDQAPWAGTATELSRKLTELIPDCGVDTRDWPRSPRELSACLRRLAPNLRDAGIEVQFGQTPGNRSKKTISISRLRAE
jgi:hypothetical protein